MLDQGVLPRALSERSVDRIRCFEEMFEPLGLTALALQVITGLWIGSVVLPSFNGLLNPANPIGILVGKIDGIGRACSAAADPPISRTPT